MQSELQYEREERLYNRRRARARKHFDAINKDRKEALEKGKAYVDTLVQRMPKIIEHIKANPEWREITVTIKPSCKIKGKLYYHYPDVQYKSIIDCMHETLRKRKMSGLVQGEFHKNGNVHVHGVIYHETGYDIHYMRLLRYLKGKIGRTTITEIRNKDNWLSYMFKEAHKSGLKETVIGVTPAFKRERQRERRMRPQVPEDGEKE